MRLQEHRSGAQAGFTLAEMAVVVVIAGMLILIVYPGLVALRSSTQRQTTDAAMQALLRTTAAFVQSTGCLPCPAPASATGSGFGRVRGDGSANAAACAGCSQPEGIVPFMTLGLPAASARDGWGHWITMRVDPTLTLPFGVVPPASGGGQSGLCMANLSSQNTYVSVSTPNASAQKASVIFVSHGPNGYGALNASARNNGTNGTRLPFAVDGSCATNPEICNADGDASFTDAQPGAAFDDMLVYLDRNALVAWLGSNPCTTVW